MIFATVGTQLPFPRLMAALDALSRDLDEEILAQTGPCKDAATLWPGLDCRQSLAPAEFDAAFARARVVVAHAGIGTILSARRWRRPLILMPRRHALGEHRNDHQIATARQVAGLPGIAVAWQVEDLAGLVTGQPPETPPEATESAARSALIARLRAFIEA